MFHLMRNLAHFIISYFLKGQHLLTAILIKGYRSFELGIFKDKDPRITIIKQAIRSDLLRFIDEGADWFIFTGDLGFEYWVLEEVTSLQSDYSINTATLFAFENQGANWKESNQEKLTLFKQADFVKYSFPAYTNPSQLQQHQRFLLDNTDGAYLFYDPENETNLKYLIKDIQDKTSYTTHFLTFDRLNEIAEE